MSLTAMPSITAMEGLIGTVVKYRPREEESERWREKEPTTNPLALVPAIVVAVHSPTLVNLRIAVDGPGEIPWVTSVSEGVEVGQWRR